MAFTSGRVFMTAELVPIFVNNERVRVQGDPNPKVSKIVVNCGKEPGQVEIFRLTSQQDMYGKRLAGNDFIDRAAEVNPVYLRMLERESGRGSDGGELGKKAAQPATEKPKAPATTGSQTPPTPPSAGGPTPPSPTRRPTPGQQPKPTEERQEEQPSSTGEGEHAAEAGEQPKETEEKA